MVKSLGLLLLIIGGIFVGTYEIAHFFLKESEHRKFWLKVWLTLSVIFGLFFWLILSYWEK